jgi:WD40 repeat protein
MGTTQLRHGDAVFFAAYTPDGKALVTAGKDATVRLWDLATLQEIRRFHWGDAEHDGKPEPSDTGMPHRGEQQTWDDLALLSQAALSPDGTLVAASRGGVVCLWETATGKRFHVLRTPETRLAQLAFSADGKSLLTLGPWQATAVWDVATGQCVQRREGLGLDRLRISFFASTTEQIAVVSPQWKYLSFRKQAENDGPWRIHTRELATGKEAPPIETIDGRAPMTFTPDGRTLVWARFEGGLVFSDVATGKELRRLGNDSAQYDLATNFAFSPDGRSLAVSRASHIIEVWDLASGKQTARIAQSSQRGRNDVGAFVRPALAFAPDGKKLVSSLGGAALRQFEIGSGLEVPGAGTGHRAAVSGLVLSTDGKSLWTCGRGDPVQCWDWATGRQTQQRGVPGSATHAVVASDGHFAFADRKKITLGGPDGKTLREIATGEQPLTALALSQDGAFLAARILDDPAVHLWDAATGKELRTLGPAGDNLKGGIDVVTETTGVVTPELVFSPDGRCLAGAGPRRQLCLWDTASGNLLWEMPPQTGQATERFAFSANGLGLATVTTDHTVTLYETLTGAARRRLVTADPKKRRLHLTFSYNGGAGSMGPQRYAPVCLAFSPNGRYLAVAQETPEIHLWDVLAGREVGQLQGHEGGVVSLLFTADGKHLISGGTDTTALTWDLTRLTRLQPAEPVRLAPQALDALWTDLADNDSTRAFEALRKLSASPDQAVTLIQERVRPAPPADRQRLAHLLTDLQSDHLEVRRQAEAELQGLGERAEPVLRRALADDPAPDLRQRLQRLLDRLSGNAPPAGLLRELRAVELLELIGSPQARQVLQDLAAGAPDACLTRQAHGALQRLTR